MAFREEIIGDCRLILGDCREVLATLGRVDAVVTDPPYGIEGGRGGDARDYKKGKYAGSFDDTEEYIKTVCVPTIVTSLDLAQRGAVTPGIRCLSFYPRPADVGCFYTPAGMTHGPWGFVGFNPVLYYGKDFRAGHGALPSSITVTEQSPKIGHPCAKPRKAWEWLLNKVSRPGETVLDPFMGSGTTGVVCAKLGRRFVGIEIEPEYFEISICQIEAAYRQPDFFVQPAPSPPPQPLLFDEGAAA